MKLLMSMIFILSSSVSMANASLEAKVDALANELASLKEQMTLSESTGGDQTHSGLGVSASKVYFSKSPLSIGGYGEVVVQNVQGETGDTADALRFVPYIGYRFTDKIILNAEIEIEHADEIFLEFGYLDFLLSESFNIRTGVILAPIGITNQMHEPTLFPSVNRSEVESNIIPTTLRENGLLVYGAFGDFDYSVGLMNSLDAEDFSSAGNWVRGGRQKASQAKANDWSWLGRLDWSGIDGLLLGASIMTGNTSHGDSTRGDGALTIWDIHFLYTWRALQLKALYVEGTLDDADLISTANGVTIGSKTKGYYVEAQYNIMSLINAASTSKLNVFTRLEDYNTHEEVGTGFTADAANDRQRTVVGFNYMPHSNVILKTNWVFRNNESSTEEADLFELGMGYIF